MIIPMKARIFILGTLATLGIFASSCQEQEDVQPFIHPIIGEWETTSIQLYSEGIEKAPTDFAIEVFSLSEVDALKYIEDYLQNQVLGPINLSGGKIQFDENNSLRSIGSEDTLEGIWSLFNSGSVLRLEVENLPLNQYNFDIISLSTNKLELKHEATIEIIKDGGNEVVNYEVLIKLIK
jgi:hypothetical protein